MNESNIQLHSKDEFQREKQYLAARSVVESMHKSGIISDKELSEIDTILLKKYRPSLSALLCGKPLNNSEKDGIMVSERRAICHENNQ
jgi:hypothetical protein